MSPGIDPTAVAETVVAALPGWLPGQRWFAGKDRPVLSAAVEHAALLVDADPALVHLIVSTDQGSRARDRYQLLVGARQSMPDPLMHAWIADWADFGLYDAVHDSELTGQLLVLLAQEAWVDGIQFELEAGTELDTELRGRPIGAEQSNTSLVFGREYILKLFRRLVPGTNRDLELHRALHKVGCQHVAPPFGAIHGVSTAAATEQPITLGMLQQFLPDAADGWAMATASVRDLMAEGDLHADEVGGDFAAESHRLGQAVAEVHADLRRALGSTEVEPDQLAALAAAMNRRLDSVLELVPELAAHENALRSAFDVVAAGSLTTPILVQQIHGDLHLGQVLRTVTGWVLIDFEGEPASPVAERSIVRTPLRDVAGMLRSFDYAAHQMLVGNPDDHQLTVRALEWADRNRVAFCDGYAEIAADPRAQADLLRALELDKAVYEVAYEHGNRPEWLAIPLASIARITAGEDQS